MTECVVVGYQHEADGERMCSNQAIEVRERSSAALEISERFPANCSRFDR